MIFFTVIYTTIVAYAMIV
ncbi:putative membrane protein, partial [Vibrio harveyi]